MISKIARQECLAMYPKFPWRGYDEVEDEDLFFHPRVFSHYILTLNSKSFKGNASLMGRQLKALIVNLGFDSLIFLGDVSISWRYQNNTFNPVREALNYLIENKVGKQFDGALEVETNELPIFIKHLSWLVRCNASLPYFYFCDKGQNIMASLCKYGNLHIDSINSCTDNFLLASIRKSDFKILNTKECFNRHGKTSAIHKRQIVL